MRKFLILIFLVIFFRDASAEIITDEACRYRDQGYALQSNGDLQAAMSAYQKAVQINPQYVEAYNDLGVVYEEAGDNDSALNVYKKAIELNTEYLPAYTNLAFLYEKMGDVEKASFYWQKRYQKGQQGEYWTETAAKHLLELGTYPELKKMTLEKAAAQLSQEVNSTREQIRLKNNTQAQNYYEMALQLFKKGDFPNTIKELAAARVAGPSDQNLIQKIDELTTKAEYVYNKEQALALTQSVEDNIKNEDYLTAAQNLKAAQTVLTRLSAKRNK